MPRPTKKTEGMIAAILGALEAGVTRTGAAAAAGIHYDTFHTWVTTDPEFSDAVTRAEALSEPTYVDIIRRAATSGRVTRFYDKASGDLIRETEEPDWKAAAWMLERRVPAYSQRQSVEVSGPNGGPIALSPVLAAVPHEELEAAVKELEAELGDTGTDEA